MASILDRYGIKEVADVTFYDLDNNGNPIRPVLYLDTLKVSTVEQTAENTSARGGKGNPELISWDYGKEITVTLEDALFSAKSMAIMFGNGSSVPFETAQTGSGDSNKYIMKTEVRTLVDADGSGSGTDLSISLNWTDPEGKIRTMINPKAYTADGKNLNIGANGVVTVPSGAGATYTIAAGDKIFVTYDIAAKGSVIEVSANTFPGTYYVTGDTFARSEASGNDEFFQLVFPKAKVQSENTITMEAEGDSSVFNMSLRVLRPADGVMMKLIKYELMGDGTAVQNSGANIIHNHILSGTGFNPVAG